MLNIMSIYPVFIHSVIDLVNHSSLFSNCFKRIVFMFLIIFSNTCIASGWVSSKSRLLLFFMLFYFCFYCPPSYIINFYFVPYWNPIQNPNIACNVIGNVTQTISQQLYQSDGFAWFFSFWKIDLLDIG